MLVQAGETSTASDGPLAALSLAEHLRANVSRYFPDAGGEPLEVRLVHQDVRRASTLYRFAIDTKWEHRDVLAKVPRIWENASEAAGVEEAGDRPRFARALAPEHRVSAEYQTLAAIHEHFLHLDDARFGAVRVLDLLPARHALIMETVPGTTLRKMLYKAHRGAGAAAASRLEEAFANTGAWLRAYQELQPPRALELRHTRRADYVEFVRRVACFLGRQLDDAVYFDQVSAAARAKAEECLPDELPLGVGHGDFALRNVIVGACGRVTVLDTAARFRTPIYADIGYFLVSLRYNGPQILSLGTAFPADRLAACERAFLNGYFGRDPVPEGAVRLYELLALLDFWSAAALRRVRANDSWARLASSLKLTHLSRLARRRLDLDSLV